MSATDRSYLAFAPQHTPSEHMVLAVVDRGDGPEAEALVSFADAPEATMLTSALNGILLQRYQRQRRFATDSSEVRRSQP